MASFEATKSDIVSSSLGQVIGLTTSSIWSQIVEKIKAVINCGAVSQVLNCGGSYTIPQGYHNGSGKVMVNSLASQTDANASAAQILSGFTAWIKGNKVTGSMPNRGALNWSGSNTTYGVPAGYYSGGTLDSRPSYNNGYNAGVAVADGRVNTGSASYTSGYNAGVNAGKSAALSGITGSFTSGDRGSSYTIQTGFNTIYAVVMFYEGGGDSGLIAYTRHLGTRGIRGSNWTVGLSLSGGNIIYTATNSNWANRKWNYHIFGM